MLGGKFHDFCGKLHEVLHGRVCESLLHDLLSGRLPRSREPTECGKRRVQKALVV
jgi:hypothetical protein